MLEKPPSWGGQEVQPAGGGGHRGKAAEQGGGVGAHSALSGHWLPREGWISNIRQLAWAAMGTDLLVNNQDSCPAHSRK